MTRPFPRILKVVNSAFYGVSGQVGSVDRAIVLLGMTAVKNIAVAASLGQLFRGAKLGAGVSARDLWNHCISVGVVARELAKNITGVNSEEIFLAGLIHDVGILIELQTWPEKLQAVCTDVKNTGSPFCEVERQMLGVDHQMLGKGLAETWKFTRSCQQVAGFHHDPAGASEVHRPLVTLVYLADTICGQEAQGFTLTSKTQQIDPSMLSFVGLDQTHLDAVKENMADRIKDAMGIFA